MIRDLRINPRHDLQSPYVLINYETTEVINGSSWLVPSQDFYPNPLPTAPLQQFNALRATISLQGLQAQTTTASLVCEAINANSGNVTSQINWWLSRHPQYRPFDPTIPPNAGSPAGVADPNNPVTGFELIAGSVTVAPTKPGETLQNFPNELTAGQIAPWMNFGAQRVTISCKANLTHRNGNVIKEHPLTYQCVATNAVTGDYTNQTVTAFQEPTPVGLAQALYNSVSVLQYEGELTLQEEDCSARLGIGNLFNLTGGRLAEWATMNALVQSVTENLDTGATTIEFGPPKHLSAGELVDLLRVNRSRNTFYPPSIQTSGTAGGGNGSIGLGNSTPEKNSASTSGFTQSAVVSGAVDGSGPLVVSQVVTENLLLGTALFAFTQWTPNGPFSLTGPSGPVAVDDPRPRNPPGSVTIDTGDIQSADLGSGVFLKLRKLPLCLNGASGTMYFLCSQFIPDL